jgi:hypothetical protein
LAVVTGRRRVGKTRLLVEWVEQNDGVYFVADQSSSEVQRRYFTAALAAKLRGLDGVTFVDWRALLTGVAERALEAKWTGPLVIDEIPYLVLQAPELPSVLQQFIDHDAKRARLTVAIAGSSQRMMQGLVMNASAPLFGRQRDVEALLHRPAPTFAGPEPSSGPCSRHTHAAACVRPGCSWSALATCFIADRVDRSAEVSWPQPAEPHFGDDTQAACRFSPRP